MLCIFAHPIITADIVYIKAIMRVLCKWMHCGLVHPFCTLSDVSHNTELWAKTGCLTDLYIASRMNIPNRCMSVAVKGAVSNFLFWKPLIKCLHFLTDITEIGLLRKHGPCDSYRFCRQQKKKNSRSELYSACDLFHCVCFGGWDFRESPCRLNHRQVWLQYSS